MPAMGELGFPYESAGHGDPVGPGQVGVDDGGESFGTDRQFAQTPGVPGVGAFRDSSVADLDW